MCICVGVWWGCGWCVSMEREKEDKSECFKCGKGDDDDGDDDGGGGGGIGVGTDSDNCGSQLSQSRKEEAGRDADTVKALHAHLREQVNSGQCIVSSHTHTCTQHACTQHATRLTHLSGTAGSNFEVIRQKYFCWT